MDFSRIYELCNLIPEDSNYFSGLNSVTSVDTTQDHAVCKFLLSYKDLSFGYRLVRSFITSGKRMPVTIADDSLRRLYNFERYRLDDYHVLKTLALRDKSNIYAQNVLEALLITPNITIEDISKETGLEAEVVRLYEELFFNVLDRKHESMLIGEIVYPEHRLVEMFDNYLRNESLGAILKRTGYNNGVEDVLFLAGMRSSSNVLNASNITEQAVKLETAIMANGYFLARNGFLSQRNAVGVNNARNLIAASKQGGAESAEEDVEGFGNSIIGGQLLEDAVASKRKELPKQLDLRGQQGSLRTVI